MKVWKFVLIFTLFIGCARSNINEKSVYFKDVESSQIQVHLHVYGFKSLKSSKDVEFIGSKGFDVKKRENAYPGSKRASFIIYNLLPENLHMLEDLEEALSEEGVEIEHIYSVRYGKHEYTPGNIGVYLF